MSGSTELCDPTGPYAVTLPSSAAGRVTQTVGFFETNAEVLTRWLQDSLGADWATRPSGWQSLEQAAADLQPCAPLSRRGVIPVGEWTLVLTNGPGGTDVGMLPSLAARELGCRAVRAVCVEDGDHEYPARILELFGPAGVEPLLAQRSIAAANDGGTWVFETSGDPLPFERLDQYRHRRKSERLTSGTLYDYLRQLGVPIDDEPEWNDAQIVELSAPRTHRAFGWLSHLRR